MARSPGCNLEKKFRLHESLFFDPRAIVPRAPRVQPLNRCANVIMDFLKVDPLKGDQKKLTKYLLQATLGPVYGLGSKHLNQPWTTENNRASYEGDFRSMPAWICAHRLQRNP